MSSQTVIHHLFVSPGHNYFGHHGKPAGEHAMHDVASIRCRAGLGIEGDRFFGYRPDYKGQVTFFDWSIYETAKRRFNLPELGAASFRRNIVIQGVDLIGLIGRRFTIGAVEFVGEEESRPCYWMDTAVAPGAEQWLRGNGGLRARILSDGELRRGPQMLVMRGESAEAPVPAASVPKVCV